MVIVIEDVRRRSTATPTVHAGVAVLHQVRCHWWPWALAAARDSESTQRCECMEAGGDTQNSRRGTDGVRSQRTCLRCMPGCPAHVP